MTSETLLLILNFVLGGGLITAIVSIFTLRSRVKEAQAKAEQALAEAKRMQAEAKSKELENDKTLVDSFNEYIVTPLKTEVNGLRKDVRRLNRAIEKINDCPHAANCPVRRELQDGQELHAGSNVATDGTEK
ncbi:MAG: hypothetical protein J5621_01970 [Paludibacteraceae bacterium]|nr:hypothetical protein [Paludibacteraceae bacterium]